MDELGFNERAGTLVRCPDDVVKEMRPWLQEKELESASSNKTPATSACNSPGTTSTISTSITGTCLMRPIIVTGDCKSGIYFRKAVEANITKAHGSHGHVVTDKNAAANMSPHNSSRMSMSDVPPSPAFIGAYVAVTSVENISVYNEAMLSRN